MGYEGYDDGSLGHDMLLHVITYYRIHPYTIYYQPISIVAHIQSWGSTFPPPRIPVAHHGPGTALGGLSDCSSRWISQRLAGSATGHLPMRMRRLRASQAGTAPSQY